MKMKLHMSDDESSDYSEEEKVAESDGDVYGLVQLENLSSVLFCVYTGVKKVSKLNKHEFFVLLTVISQDIF